MRMDGKPASVAAFQGNGAAPGPGKALTVFVKPGRRPGRHAPGVRVVAAGMNAVHIDAEIGDIAPDAFPLILAQRGQTLDHVGAGAEGDDVVGKDGFASVIVHSGAIPAQQFKPLPGSFYGIGFGDAHVPIIAR